MVKQKDSIVLVVDDRVSNLVTTEKIRRHGMLVKSILSYQEGMRELKTGKYNILVTDMIFPEGVKGLELAKEAKNRGMKVIAVTSDYSFKSPLFDAYAGKPFNLKAMEKVNLL